MQVVRESVQSNLRMKQTEDSGVRVSNAWITYLHTGDNTAKVVLIPNVVIRREPGG